MWEDCAVQQKILWRYNENSPIVKCIEELQGRRAANVEDGMGLVIIREHDVQLIWLNSIM